MQTTKKEGDCIEPCPIGNPENHDAHDARIKELEDFLKTLQRTPRMMGERIIKLEKGLKTLFRLLPKDKQEIYNEWVRKNREKK